jgi:transposase-like protein
MIEKYKCDVCQDPMVFVERIESQSKYRIRRFKCSICDYRRTIFAQDARDSIFEPRKALKDVEIMYDQEEENRND